MRYHIAVLLNFSFQVYGDFEWEFDFWNPAVGGTVELHCLTLHTVNAFFTSIFLYFLVAACAKGQQKKQDT